MSILAPHTIGFVGAGNMAEALIRGLVRGKHVEASNIVASAPRRERLDELADAYGIAVTLDNGELGESFAPRRRRDDLRGRDVVAAHQTADQCLGHVAGADEADRVGREDRHGQPCSIAGWPSTPRTRGSAGVG